MSAISPPERPRRNVALIVSICVNLVLAGIIVMAVFRILAHMPLLGPGPSGPMQGPVERLQMRQIMSPRLLIRLAPDRRAIIRATAMKRRDEIDRLRDTTIAARREVLRVYVAPVLDKVALDKALAGMRAADAAFEVETTKLLLETSAVLSPEERKAAVEWHPRSFSVGWHFRVGHGDHGNQDDRGGDGPPPGNR